MPAICRETDSLSTGHGCDGSSTLKSGSQEGNSAKVYANSLGVSVTGDPVTSHDHPVGLGCGTCPSPVTGAGSPNVFVNGIAVIRNGDQADQVDAWGAMTAGSPNVFVNGL